MKNKILTKVCTVCGEDKPATVEFFSRNRRMKDGLFYTCKDCYNTVQLAYQAKHRAKKLAGEPIRFRAKVVVLEIPTETVTVKRNKKVNHESNSR